MTSTPENTKGSWFARHKILTAIIVVIIIAAIAKLAGGSSDTPEATSSSAASQAAPATEAATTESTQSAAPEKTPAPETPAATIGTPVEVGDFTITVEGVETGISSVGNEYLGAEAQGQFVVVSASILNNGDKAETFFTDSMKIIDDQGRQHSYSTDAALYLEGSWVLDKINPGNTLSGKFVFDIPADSVPTKVLLEGGFLGKDVEVALN